MVGIERSILFLIFYFYRSGCVSATVTCCCCCPWVEKGRPVLQVLLAIDFLAKVKRGKIQFLSSLFLEKRGFNMINLVKMWIDSEASLFFLYSKNKHSVSYQLFL